MKSPEELQQEIEALKRELEYKEKEIKLLKKSEDYLAICEKALIEKDEEIKELKSKLHKTI